jgi:hypothetical protein
MSKKKCSIIEIGKYLIQLKGWHMLDKKKAKKYIKKEVQKQMDSMLRKELKQEVKKKIKHYKEEEKVAKGKKTKKAKK